MVNIMKIHNRFKSSSLVLFLIISSLTVLSACGKKGPLYLPAPIEAPASAPAEPVKLEIPETVSSEAQDKSSNTKPSEQ